jgi:hypothetical protein
MLSKALGQWYYYWNRAHTSQSPQSGPYSGNALALKLYPTLVNRCAINLFKNLKIIFFPEVYYCKPSFEIYQMKVSLHN